MDVDIFNNLFWPTWKKKSSAPGIFCMIFVEKRPNFLMQLIDFSFSSTRIFIFLSGILIKYKDGKITRNI